LAALLSDLAVFSQAPIFTFFAESLTTKPKGAGTNIGAQATDDVTDNLVPEIDAIGIAFFGRAFGRHHDPVQLLMSSRVAELCGNAQANSST
jgi:hypothetical protein